MVWAQQDADTALLIVRNAEASLRQAVGKMAEYRLMAEHECDVDARSFQLDNATLYQRRVLELMERIQLLKQQLGQR